MNFGGRFGELRRPRLTTVRPAKPTQAGSIDRAGAIDFARFDRGDRVLIYKEARR